MTLDREEEARLAAVERYDLLDMPRDGPFDRLTALAARIFELPISIITVVDRDRIWLLSHHGTSIEGIARADQFPAPALPERPFVISDSGTLPLGDSLLPGEHDLRFYAAAPLVTVDGFILGALCVLGGEPREMNEHELATLADLAAIVVDELELYRAAGSEAQRLEQVRSDFTLTVSHELKTPLAAVYGAAMTLSRQDGTVSDQTRQRLLDVIAEQGERLRNMFEQVLTTSQLESGSFPIVPSEFDPRELLQTAAEAARVYLPPNLTIDIRAAIHLRTVHADTRRVAQIVENLIDNAVKYSPEGGRIELGADTSADTIRFWVNDQGPGVPAHESENIFTRYYRLDPGLRSGVAGTGLGLYVCRQLANRMGGHLDLEPHEGQGSTFTLTLPLNASA